MIVVAENAKTVYKELQAGKHRYIIFRIQDQKEIVVEKTGDRDQSYSNFVDNELGDEECRYAVFDFPISADDGKLILITWLPEPSEVKQKMLYMSGFNPLMAELEGIQKYIEGGEKVDISEDKIRQSFS